MATYVRVALLVAVLSGVNSLWSQNPRQPLRGEPTSSRVPFVGCRSDGQVGPSPAPMETGKLVKISASIAERLSYYKASTGPGVLAPRGWYCFGTYGSGGSTLFITPKPVDESKVFSGDWQISPGPAIELAYRNGGTSGRDAVAKVIARVFPAYRDFADKVNAMFGSATEFAYGPYPNDKLTYRSDRAVEYFTPPNSDGLGATGRLRPDSESIHGIAILLGKEPSEPDLLLLSMRLPPVMKSLESPIIATLEGEADK